MVHFKAHHVQLSLLSSRMYFKVQIVRKVQVLRASRALNHRDCHIKKTIHTTPSFQKQRDDGDDDYELDLITLTRRKKQKKQTSSESKVVGDRTPVTDKNNANVRFDDYISKKPKKRVPYLDSEDVRQDDGLINITSKDAKKIKAREKFKAETPIEVKPLFEPSQDDETTPTFTEEEINKFNLDIKSNLTRYLDEEYDKVHSKKPNLKVKDLYGIIAAATAKNRSHPKDKLTKQSNKPKSDKQNVVKTDDGLIKSTGSSNVKVESNAKSDDDLVSVSAGQIREEVKSVNKDIKSDDDLVLEEDNKDSKGDDGLVSTGSNEIKDFQSNTKLDDDLIPTGSISNAQIPTEDPQSNSTKANEILDYLTSQPKLEPEGKDIEHKVIEDDPIANIAKPHIDTSTSSGFVYNTKEPEIDELNKIINVAKSPSKSQLKRIKKRNKALLSDLTNLSPNEKINKIDDIMQILENEIPRLSKESTFSDSEVRATTDRIKHLRENFENVQKVEPQTFGNADISLKDLEGFLKDAKKKQVSRDEEHFREERAYEIARLMNNKNARTLDKKNFFTPVDTSLTNKVSSTFRFKPDEKPSTSSSKSDELFFPSIRSKKGLTHEFMVLTKSKKIVTEENPLGDDYHPRDLFTIFKTLGNPEKYLKQINKLEKNGGWKLIGSGGDAINKILVFERFVNKEQEKKDIRKRRIRRFALSFTTVFVLLYGFGSYFEHQQKAQYKIDESGKVVKSS